MQYIDFERINRSQLDDNELMQRKLNSYKQFRWSVQFHSLSTIFGDQIQQILFAGRIAVFDIYYDSEGKKGFEKVRKNSQLIGYLIDYENEEGEQQAELDEDADCLAIVKIRSFKEFAHGNLGLDLARDLKKGAIVKVEDQDLFLSLAGADLIAVADNKNLLSDVFRVMEGKELSLRGTSLERVVIDFGLQKSCRWLLKNHSVRTKRWLEYAEEKGHSDDLAKDIEKESESLPKWELESFLLSGKFVERHVFQFHSFEAAQEKFKHEKKLKDSPTVIGKVWTTGEGYIATPKTPLDKVKTDLNINGDRVEITKTFTPEDYQAEIEDRKRRQKMEDERRKRRIEHMKRYEPEKYKKYLEWKKKVDGGGKK